MSVSACDAAPFQAPWPESMRPTLCKKVARIAWNVFSVVIFPIGLVRLANHYLVRPLIIRKLILPAVEMYRGSYFGPGRVAFKTAAGNLIEGVYWPASGKQGTAPPRRKLILCAVGNGGCCTGILSLKVLRDSGASILSINAAGVGGSEGFPGRGGLDLEESLALPVFSAYTYAREELGYGAEDICLYGISLGGVAVTLGAKLIQEHYGENAVKLVNDRSLRSIADIAVGFALAIKRAFKEGTTYLEIVRSTEIGGRLKLASLAIKAVSDLAPDCLIKLVTRLGVRLLGIELDAEKAFLSLKTREKCVIYFKEDKVIPYQQAALYQGVRGKTDFSRVRMREGEAYKHSHSSDFAALEQRYVLGQFHAFLGVDSEESRTLPESVSSDKIFRRFQSALAS